MNFKYENSKLKEGYQYVIGCDEVGRGSLAGPVVAAAVAFAPASLKLKVESYKEIKDSKLLEPEKREELSEIIKSNCLKWSIAEVSSSNIDRINIHQATLLAMSKALHKLLAAVAGRRPKAFVFVDGQFKIPECEHKQEAVIDGDNKVLSIAAASIIAKVYRDNLMCKLHQKYPLYNFAQHKGYGTLEHRKTIIRYGLSPVHRLSFCGNFI